MTLEKPPLIFDPKRQQSKLNRAITRIPGDPFLWRHMAIEIADRLVDIDRQFENVLLIGPAGQYEKDILAERSPTVTRATFSPVEAKSENIALVESDLLPFDAESFDLVICLGMLESLNDLPGILVQLRRLLRPDGLFLGSIFGAGTLSTLKSAMIAAEGDSVGIHIHPQIDLKTISELVVRAGFALPVIDRDDLTVRYGQFKRLVADLRDMGLGNILSGEPRYFGKEAYLSLEREWQSRVDGDGKVSENFTFLQLLGWAPSEDQPKPARRGSAKVSLAEALSSKVK
mgnify:CR=1 FL=1